MPFPILFEIFLITEIWTFGGTSSEDFGPYLNPVFDKHAAGRRGTAPISAHVAPSVLRMSPGTHVSLPPQTRPLLALRTGLCAPVLGGASPRPLGGDSVLPCPRWGKSPAPRWGQRAPLSSVRQVPGPSVGTAYAPVLSGASPWPLSGDSVRPSSVGPCCAPTLHGEDVGPTLGGGAVGCRTGLWVPG